MTRTELERPAWAKAAIVATYVEDRSDSQTDYFNSVGTRTVFLAWSKHTRDLFPEMRKAAATFAETAHLGPGKGVFLPRIVFTNQVRGNGCWHSVGDWSPWHRDFDHDDSYRPVSFETREEAEAHIAKMGDPHPIGVGDDEARFEWQIGEAEIEHREKYSMGHGYYLKASHRYTTGWEVSKTSWNLDQSGEWELPEMVEAEEEKREPDKLHIRLKSYGLEIEFPDKPSDHTRAMLKSGGFRWHRKNRYWYAKNTPETQDVARKLRA